MKLSRRIGIVLLAGVLSACGFHLRGVATLPPELQSIQLVTDNLTVSQESQLNRSLVQAGASITNDGSPQRGVRLKVAIRPLPERTLVNTVGSNIIIVQLSRELRYSLTAASGEHLVDQKTILRRQDLQLDSDNALSIEYEKTSAIESLDRLLINQLIIELERF
jgi:LPS-assembly lipoprotein